VLLNESAVRRFGWEEPIGKRITYPSAGEFEVIGVMKDFHFMTLHQPIQPFALFHQSSASYRIPDAYVVARIELDDVQVTLKAIEDEWKTLASGAPFEYTFLDEALVAEYRAERRLGTIFLVFAGLAIGIACLGLLGLAAFTAEKRTKEIGVRKVLGASVPGVLGLLVRDFTKWVLAANLIAWPVAWVGMNRWLEGFAYRIDVGISPFLIAGAVALAIAVLTVGTHAVKAARANPVDALRYE